MTAPREVLELVNRFDRNVESYRSGQYNETQLRREFLDPFFECLGWDVNNRLGLAEAYKDVIHEDAIKVGGATEAPDYCFRIGGTRKFFVEAKKPAINIKDQISPAYQLRRYAWSAKLPLSILSDFEEFAVYDCRSKPAKTDKPAIGRIMFLESRDYPDHWDELAAIFSKDAVLKGSFDKYAETNKAKKGTAEVDAAFLKEIESWRDWLARNFALRNPQLTQRELNFAVQRTIDRIIFLRIAEDRRIEDYGRLLAITNGEHVYKRLCELFERADERYNSGLFHFHQERDRAEPPDELTLQLKLDDDLLAGIIRSLYYPESPYEFSVLPADILGQVYEQFLGKVIRLTPGHRAVVEDKPEVKKAGGVYYTPTYIVDYIVKHTVGELLDPPLPLGEGRGEGREAGKQLQVGTEGPHPNPLPGGEGTSRRMTPKQAVKLRILDPACGSGSFLIGAYQFLLDWHLKWYTEHDPAEHATGRHTRIFQGPGGWRLTTAERKRILLANLYGVDIDPQAVETTKLSLLLKVLEGESHESLERQRRLFHERALPDLGRNIKCGNSLIGPDFYDSQQMSLLDDEDRLRINVFDWHAEFSAIMKAGGFDAVIGNPPYIRIQRIAHAEADYVFAKYDCPTSKFDLSLVFLERALKLTNSCGRVGFICTSQWLSTKYGRKLRGMLSDGRLHEIVDFGSLPVFQHADTYPAILVLSPTPDSHLRLKRILGVDQLNLVDIEKADCVTVPFEILSEAPWSLGTLDISKLLDLKGLSWKPLKEFGKAYIGTKSGMIEAFVVTRESAKEARLERSLLYPYAYRGGEVERYTEVKPDELLIYPYTEGPDGAPKIVTESALKSDFPNIHRHLLSFKDDLRKRQDSRRLYAVGADWYRHLRAGSFRYLRPKKLVLKGIAKRSCVGLLPENTAFDGARCPAIIIEDLAGHELTYILAILNSRLASYHLRGACPQKLSGYIEFSATCVSQCPIRFVDFADSQDKGRHDSVANLGGQMLALHRQLAGSKTAHERTALERQIEVTDRQIDRLVYELYGLTEEEIAIVEEATSSW
ncbi:MAG: Eco57I restriction-modification methylase domain-containing protein [Planctomycetes bacterium]|nr:Eco57I restriction-modification methylase domain-containing protein [Planctomycetota bacterium]